MNIIKSHKKSGSAVDSLAGVLMDLSYFISFFLLMTGVSLIPAHISAILLIPVIYVFFISSGPHDENSSVLSFLFVFLSLFSFVPFRYLVMRTAGVSVLSFISFVFSVVLICITAFVY